MTCSIKEMTFFLSYVYPKTAENGAAGAASSLTLYLNVLSAVHDRLGQDVAVAAHPDMAGHVTKLMSQGRGMSRHVFVCYVCPASFVSLAEMRDHLDSIGHRMAKMGNRNKECLRYFTYTVNGPLDNGQTFGTALKPFTVTY